MNELKKINATIAKKQVLRIGGSILGIGLGLVQLAKFMYQKGVTDCQENLHNEFVFFGEQGATIYFWCDSGTGNVSVNFRQGRL